MMKYSSSSSTSSKGRIIRNNIGGSARGTTTMTSTMRKKEESKNENIGNGPVDVDDDQEDLITTSVNEKNTSTTSSTGYSSSAVYCSYIDDDDDDDDDSDQSDASMNPLTDDHILSYSSNLKETPDCILRVGECVRQSQRAILGPPPHVQRQQLLPPSTILTNDDDDDDDGDVLDMIIRSSKMEEQPQSSIYSGTSICCIAEEDENDDDHHQFHLPSSLQCNPTNDALHVMTKCGMNTNQAFDVVMTKCVSKFQNGGTSDLEVLSNDSTIKFTNTDSFLNEQGTDDAVGSYQMYNRVEGEQRRRGGKSSPTLPPPSIDTAPSNTTTATSIYGVEVRLTNKDQVYNTHYEDIDTESTTTTESPTNTTRGPPSGRRRSSISETALPATPPPAPPPTTTPTIQEAKSLREFFQIEKQLNHHRKTPNRGRSNEEDGDSGTNTDTDGAVVQFLPTLKVLSPSRNKATSPTPSPPQPKKSFTTRISMTTTTKSSSPPTNNNDETIPKQKNLNQSSQPRPFQQFRWASAFLRSNKRNNRDKKKYEF